MDTNKVTLHCTEGGSDKIYIIWAEPKDGGYMVPAQWGRRGNSLQSGNKTTSPVSLEKATAILNKAVKEKLGKGYKYYGEEAPTYTHIENAKDTGIRLMLLTAGTEDDLEWLTKDDQWAAQEKKNGKRIAIDKSDNGSVIGINRKGLECPIPETVVAGLFLHSIPFVLDGEVVKDEYHIFDLIEYNGKDYRNLPLVERYKAFNITPFKHLPLITGEKGKRKLVKELRESRKEGVVFKRLDGVYLPGKVDNMKKASAIKVKFYAEGSFIVNEWNDKSSVSLLAIDSNGDKVHVGNVTVPVKYHEQVKHGCIVSVKYLFATDASILYQPNLNPDDNGIVIRDDIPESDCVISQLKYEGKD